MTKAGIFGSQGSSEGSEKDPDVVALRSTNLFEKAVVIDTICDVSIRSDPPETLLESQKPAFVLAPRNSLVCRLLTTGNRLSETSDIVCFPFFSSHFVLPVKPGEQVWIFRQKALSESDRDQMYWISRVSDVLPVEDVNFSPFSRVYWITQSGSLPPDRVLGFPNGSEDQQLILGESDALQNLINGSVEAKSFALEPVPRFTKRPGDMVIQGSNNSAIILGTDRGWDVSDRPANPEKSNASTESPLETSAGSIDVVTGRGRYFNPPDEETNRDRSRAFSGVVNSTQPFVAANSFGKFETDKDPGSTQDLNNDLVIDGEAPPKPGNPKTNPAEGDPDFLVDASRIYVSSNTHVDKRLGLDRIVATGFETQSEPKIGPAIAIKSDHIRIVARKLPLQATDGNLPENFETAAGTIRIVKEGNTSEDLATITIESDGTIQISGTKIFLGRTADDGGAGGGQGPGNSQPYIKYKEMEDLWKETMDTLSAFCDTVLTHVTPGFGAPSPQLNKAAVDMKTKIASKLKKNIETVKSERIFGE